MEPALAFPPRNQLRHLRGEIDDQDPLLVGGCRHAGLIGRNRRDGEATGVARIQWLEAISWDCRVGCFPAVASNKVTLPPSVKIPSRTMNGPLLVGPGEV